MTVTTKDGQMHTRYVQDTGYMNVQYVTSTSIKRVICHIIWTPFSNKFKGMCVKSVVHHGHPNLNSASTLVEIPQQSPHAIDTKLKLPESPEERSILISSMINSPSRN